MTKEAKGKATGLRAWPRRRGLRSPAHGTWPRPSVLAYRLLLLALFSLTALLHAATPPPEKLLPADTLGFVSAPSWDAAAAAFSQNTLGQLWADPAMRPFREKFLSRFQAGFLEPLEKELACNVTNFANLLQGQVTLAFTPSTGDGPPGGKSGFLFFADTGTNGARLTKNLAEWRKRWTAAGKPSKSARIRDLDFTTLEVAPAAVSRLLDKILPTAEAPKPEATPAATNAGWTVGQSGSLLIVSDSPRDIEKLLARQAGGTLPSPPPPPALAEQAVYAADAGQFRDGQLCAWLNLKAIFERLAKEPATSNAAPDQGSVPMAQMLGALGLADAQSAVASVQQSPAGALVSLRVRVPDTARKGLFRVLSLEAKDCAPPAFVPADTVKFTRLRLDLPKAWENVEATLADVSPQSANAIRFIIANAGKSDASDFDLRTNLIARLSDDLILCEKFPRASSAKDTDSPPSLWLVGARNPDQAAAALKAIATLPPPELARYKERDFLGRKVYSFNWPSSDADGVTSVTPVHYAANGSYVALSSEPTLIEDFLRSSADTGPALRDRAGLPEAAQRVGGLGAGYFATANDAESARGFFAAARQDTFNAAALLARSTLGSRLGMGGEGGLLGFCDFSTLPPYERVAHYFHFDVSAITVNAEGYTYRLFAPTPPSSKK